MAESFSTEDQIAYAWQSLRNVRAARSVEDDHLARYIRPELVAGYGVGGGALTSAAAIQAPIAQLWDTAAPEANDMFARGLWSMTHNSSAQWFGYKPDKAVEGDSEVKAWFAKVNADIRQQLDTGGIYPSLLERLKDAGAMGYGALYSRPRTGSQGELGWEYVPSHECFYTLNEEGGVETFIRPLSLTAYQAIRERKWKGLHPSVQSAFDRKDFATKFLFLHVVWRNEESASKRRKRARTNQDYDFAGYFYEVQSRKIIDRHGFRDMPYHVLHWGGSSSVPYPTSIGYMILPEVRTINGTRRLYYRLLQNEAESPVLAPMADEGPGGQQFLPGANEFLWGGMNAQGQRLYEPYYTGSGSRTVKEEVNESRMIIQNAYHYQLFMMQNQREMTAEEVRSRDAKIIQAMGPFLVVLARDLKTIVDRQFFARLNANVYDPIPDALRDNSKMDLRFTGLLAKAQEILEGQQIVQYAMEGAAFAQLSAGAAQAVEHGTDWGMAWRKLGESKNLPDGIVLSAEQAAKNVKEDQERQQAAQAAAQAPGMAKAAKDGAQAMESMSNAGNENRSPMAV